MRQSRIFDIGAQKDTAFRIPVEITPVKENTGMTRNAGYFESLEREAPRQLVHAPDAAVRTEREFRYEASSGYEVGMLQGLCDLWFILQRPQRPENSHVGEFEALKDH